MRDAVNFEELIRDIVTESLHGQITPDEEIPHKHQAPDIEFRVGSENYLVECKVPAPQTQARIFSVLNQITTQAEVYAARTGNKPKLALAIPGTLSEHTVEVFRDAGIEVWDSSWIANHASRVGKIEAAIPFIGQHQGPSENISQASRAEELAERLTSITPGPDWFTYQKLCREIAEYLFCPPLSLSIWESGNFSATNRRDIILPNYSTSGLWYHFRSHYKADYIVIDAKNYSESIKKEEVLQIANYLQRHGAGLFALIFCRKEVDPRVYYTLREQWILHDKLITPLSDSDVRQMLNDKKEGGDPAELIRQKVEDFRLSL
ncbi:hypothetical protein ACH4VM_26640 [Streptomyces sp. NPDC020792]|uniref:hypothetical protein n=1 Tax=Streptomyces sp. NPDC020792 TaxID=3365089 RepID=UPI003798A73D